MPQATAAQGASFGEHMSTMACISSSSEQREDGIAQHGGARIFEDT